MFNIPFFLETPELRKIRQERQKQEIKRRLGECVDWFPKIPYDEELNIRGKSYQPKSLFEVKPSKNHPNTEKDKSCFVLSPSKRFCYFEIVIPKGKKLVTCYGRRQGTVLFDSNIRIPALYERDQYSSYREWRESPWMSYTPMEFMTLRCGTRFAKGTTVIGGLGMGHQLEEVAKRKQVKKIIVVERNEELVDWIWPQLDLGGRDDDVEFIIGDAKEEIPKLEADAALIDIYRSYGGNKFPYCPNIRKVWVWGSQYAA